MNKENITVGIPEANQPTMAEMFSHLDMNKLHWQGEALDMHLRRPGFENVPQEKLDCWVAEAERKVCIVEAIITKLKREEEYAAKMLDGAHARMELARQMNEQGEL